MKELRPTHTETKPDSKGPMIGAIVIALVIVAGSAYTYEKGWWKTPTKPVVSVNQLPQPTPPIVPARPQSGGRT